VWLIKTDKVHLDEWDAFVDASELKGKEASIKFSTVIHNKTRDNIPVAVHVKILSPTGKEVYKNNFEQELPETTPFSTSFTVRDPELWSLDNPILYSAEITVSGGGRQYDKITLPFGIRTIAASAEKGFLLNGRSVKLKGACIHHDNGLLGAAAIDRAEERKVELLKANGYNAVRCAHNQVSEHFLDACDKQGLLVIHETFDQWQEAKRSDDYHQFFDEWSKKDLTASVRRDRNHPSIIMWSIGNEIAQRADSIGEVIAKSLVNVIHQYDTTRLTTVGANDFWDRRHVGFEWDKDIHRAFRNVDIAGYNYMWWKYESDHAAYPNRIIYGSESFPKDAALNWNLVEKFSAIIGDFVWTGIDYLGEAGLGHALELAEGEHNPQFMGWPWYNAWCGDIDLCGDKKPQSFYRDIVWREKEIAMAVRPPVAPGKKEVVNGWGWTDEHLSWNWEGRENQPMRVNVYSRSPKVRLYLNNELIGEKETGRENYTATFEVPYKSGTLKAVNLDKRRETASVELKTTGEPTAVHLVADRSRINADLNDLAYVKIEIVDKEGNIVPDANLPVTIEYSGNGAVIASGNAAPDDMESFRSLTPKTFRGKALAILQPDGKAGKMQVKVSADGLKAAQIIIDLED
jgi:beta-galactosidase